MFPYIEQEMTTRSTMQIFDNYQKARMSFVQSIAEFALRPQTYEVMVQLQVLGKLLTNNVFLPLLMILLEMTYYCLKTLYAF